ncbi:MAG TPA: tetratricopeptide repeat protein [Planctomycetota bacterium]|nr:tetratricopeptide repeat protein [Planctomycetota bacterium]
MRARWPLAFVVVALLAAGVRADTIALLDGTLLENVRVTSESWQKVEYRKGKAPAAQSVKSSDVKSVEYGQTTPAWREASHQLREGDVAAASRLFEAVANDADAAPPLRAQARVEQADKLLSIGQLDLATAAYDRLLKDFPETRHLARALLGKGRALLLARRYDDALSAFSLLKTEVAARQLGEQWALEADYNSLLAAEGQGRTETVGAGYELLRVAAGSRYPDIASQADLGLARVHLAAGRLDAARPLLEAIVARRLQSPSDVVAGAYTGRGRLQLELARAARDRASAADGKGDKAAAQAAQEEAQAATAAARLDFLRVVTSYPDVVSQQPEALWFAAQCFTDLGGPEADERARSLLARCAQKYPDTSWGRKAAAAR